MNSARTDRILHVVPFAGQNVQIIDVKGSTYIVAKHGESGNYGRQWPVPAALINAKYSAAGRV